MGSARARQLNALYDSIRTKNTEVFLSGGVPDDFLNHPETDTRMAVALVIRPAEAVRQSICAVLQELHAEFPELYCYPADDLHITVLDVLRGRPGLEKPSPALLAQYKNCIEAAVSQLEPFSIQFKGLVFSDGAVMVKGFDDGGLEILRAALRSALRAEGLSLEERYETTSCHITAVRFPEKLHAPAALLKRLERCDAMDFGSCAVTGFELTYHNWYDSRKECIFGVSFPKGDLA